MSEGATPEATTGEDATSTTVTTTSSETSTATGDYPEGLGDAGKRALDQEREARRSAEKAAETASKELKRFQDAQRTDEEKRAARFAELETQNAELLLERRQTRAYNAAIAAARKAGFWDPDIGYALVRDQLEFDDDSKPKNVEALVAAIAKNQPKLINGTGSPDYGAGHRGDAAVGADMNAIIRRQAGR